MPASHHAHKNECVEMRSSLKEELEGGAWGSLLELQKWSSPCILFIVLAQALSTGFIKPRCVYTGLV